jgi:hypothetical protein
MKHFLSVSVCLVLSLAFSVKAQTDDDDHFPDAGFVYELFASDYCDPVPSDMDPVELAEMRQLIMDDDYPIVLAELTGFIAGERFGISPFGFAAPGRGFATVATVWGERADLGVVTLCIALIQMGNQAVEPGSSRLVGLRQIDQAEPGDLLAAGFVITLNPTERLSVSGDPIYRMERIGEVVINEGSFDLTSADDKGFEGSFNFEGWVALREQDQRQPLTMRAMAAGENVIERVPSLTQENAESEAEAEALLAESDRDYSQFPVPATSAEQPMVLEPAPIVRVALSRDAPPREAFYRLLDIDLPRKVEAGLDSEAADWEAAQKEAFEAQVSARFPADMPPQAVAEQLMALRESVGEVFALQWDPGRRSLIARYEHQGDEGFIASMMDFLFNEAGEQVFFSIGSEWGRSAPQSFPSADDLGDLSVK